jgi:hypothetical protein
MQMKFIAVRTIAAVMALGLLAGAAVAEPMKCSTQNQACTAGCGKFGDQKVWRACMTACSQRQAACQRTGCWDNGSSTFCGLLRR